MAQVVERQALVRQQLAAGVTVAVIAQRTGLSVNRVLRLRYEMRLAVGKTRARRPFGPQEIAHVEQMLDRGASYGQVARAVGRDRHVISRRWPGRGWTREQVREYHRGQRATNGVIS